MINKSQKKNGIIHMVGHMDVLNHQIALMKIIIETAKMFVDAVSVVGVNIALTVMRAIG